MANNKFIERLKGESTRKSVLEVKNIATKTSFASMPSGTSNTLQTYDDARGNATAVLKGTEIWKLQNNQLVAVNSIYGDGRDFTSTYTVSGNTTWVNAVYTLDRKMIFTGATKWVLKLCGHSLLSEGANTINFSLLIKFNNSPIITKNFTVTENAFEFCKEFIIDFNESEQTAIKMAEADTITLQLLCADANASATIYNGMTTLVALQRRVDGEAVASDLNTFEDIEVEVAQLREDLDDLEEYVDDTFVRLDGASIMTAPLKFMAGSMRGAVGPYLNGVSFWKLDSQGNITNIANLTDSQFLPVTTNAIDLGRSANKWKDLYLAGKAYISVINNGYDIAVPVTNSADTFALKSQVDLAANSGRMITPQGVWYAKMYAATVAPSAEDGTNYADFSQVDGQGNPIIVIYERQSGVWVQSETITPPAEYDGYVPITSKIWDIAEQAGQQGGRILWNHQSKDFTPYPQIISYENIEVTGNSTVIMPQNPSASQIVNKDYVDDKVSSSIGNGTITLTQSGNTMGTFTTNQSGDTTIALDGGSSYHPDLFDWKWADHQLNDVQWLRADTFSWQSGAVYEAAYDHLVDDIDGKTLQSETIAGTTVQFYLADDGHKICPDTQESNVAAIYTATGVAWYYILDKTNQRFKLPRDNSQNKRVLIKDIKSGTTWARVYSDGWVEQGGPDTTTNKTINLLITMADTNYTVTCGFIISNQGAQYVTKATTSFTTYSEQHTSGTNGGWLVAGYANTTYLKNVVSQFEAQYKYLYFYVGNFTQTALENTAGLNAELFNDKVDVGHEVIAFQRPTSANDYTWYRKYADGWVEMGGTGTTTSDTPYKVDLPVEMATQTSYQTFVQGRTAITGGTGWQVVPLQNTTYPKTSTSFYVQGSISGYNLLFYWRAEGMAA